MKGQERVNTKSHIVFIVLGPRHCGTCTIFPLIQSIWFALPFIIIYFPIKCGLGNRRSFLFFMVISFYQT